MPEKNSRRDDGTSVSERRRTLLKVLAASAGAYAVPLVASFSMSGLRVGEAAHLTVFEPPGLAAGNQTQVSPAAPPFGANQPPGFSVGGKQGVPFEPD